MIDITNIFGSMVFNEAVMEARLPKDTYKALKKTMFLGTPLTLDVANVVANAMKDWAVEKGATHFCHWFQPMTGFTAEKHDSFISPKVGGKVILQFSGEALVHGEPDASSFPSGGLRSTFEARGYTVWDATSYTFVKENTLFIPTAFCAYNGESLDKKTPLLRSMDALNKQALRILRLFGNDTAKRVQATVGPEQEYFLVDKEVYNKRPDLVLTGRTLFGAAPSRNQDTEEHYFGSIKPRVAAFMQEVEQELWKLGVPVKTKHNETAPAQYEIAQVFATNNVACDHNQLTMELLKKVATKHNLACLLHEKPFEGVNGSGKHNNWSLSTDSGTNILEPGETPFENAQFLLFLAAVIKAVDDYQDLLRVSCASAGNDHRLGAHEAPPAIISIFIGDDLAEILEAIELGKDYKGKQQEHLEIGVNALPHFQKDTTDRNRTSPFAFTGNKFEFRMLGSTFSVAGPNIVLNTAVAEVLKGFADTLESSKSFNAELNYIVRNTLKVHKRIIFNGNNYSDEWLKTAEEQGLSNLKNTVQALPKFVSQQEVFLKHAVFTETEIESRYEILMETYCKTITLEGLTMVDITKRLIIPACIAYQTDLANLVNLKSGGTFDDTLERYFLQKIAKLSVQLLGKLDMLESLLDPPAPADILEHGKLCSEKIFPAMQALRNVVDTIEPLVAKKHWPLPSYSDLLYSLNY
ncbi:MAG: glutamine synthetase III [Defluviitaleaceae bacterium]|nr:glutamine synthetase III [Defluviitaleaceae bacterium]